MSDQEPNSVIAIGAVMSTLGVIAVALRFHIRRKFRQSVLVDDWILIPAALLTVGMGASLITGVCLHALAYPTPRTGDPITQTNSAITVTSQIEWAFQMMQMLALGCVKLSFLFFYRRIFVGRTSTLFSKITWSLIILVSIWTVTFFISLLFACKGNWSAWWGSVYDLATKCVQTLKLEGALVITDFVTDVLIVVLPIPKIWGLQMSRGRKLAVSGVFLLGLVAVAASVVRMNQFIQVITVGFSPLADEDLTLTSNLYWSMVESGMGLIAVCLPTYRSLFGHVSIKLLLESVRSAFSLRSQPSQPSYPLQDRQGLDLPAKKYRKSHWSAALSTRITELQTTTCETSTSKERMDGIEDSHSTDDAILIKNTFHYSENQV